jgi:hypothetical protein
MVATDVFDELHVTATALLVWWTPLKNAGADAVKV